MVVRDNASQVISTMRTIKHLFPNPLLIEAFGALQAVKFGLDFGLLQVILEWDSLQVTKALRSDKRMLE